MHVVVREVDCIRRIEFLSFGGGPAHETSDAAAHSFL